MTGSTRVWVGGGVAAVGVLAFVLWTAVRPSVAAAADKPADKPMVEFTEDGKLKQPTGYRKWPFIGTPVTPNDLNGGDAAFPEFHIVYVDPDSFAHYEKTGEFRDGTVIVKELTSVGGKEATSGKGYFMGEYSGLETAIKDAKRFKDEPGNWGYFSFGHKLPLKETAALNAAASCNDCHQKNAKQDYVFTQYYPVLRAAAPKKK
ncbi:MAG: cytochrome P460 family protein [Gemmataceae bacterium]|nr:cytochrome P460 family protein [Gemmataceae bacterium]